MEVNNNIYIPKVTVRKRKLRTENYSLYLDILYKGTRTRENLDLYVIPETSRREKILNMKAYAEASRRRDERELQLMKENDSPELKFDLDMQFLDYYRSLMESRKDKYSISEYKDWNNCLSLLKGYCDETTTFKDITPQWCEGFKTYLDCVEAYSHKTSSNPSSDGFRGLSERTKHHYINKLRICIKSAFDDNIIPTNPMKDVKNYSNVGKAPVWLTWEEIKSLDRTPCLKPALKEMFLLSCFTGIRRKEMEKLTWGDVEETDKVTTITIQDKTPTGFKVIVPEQAKKYLGKRGNDEDLIFPDFKYNTFMYVELRKWALDADILKDFTFQAARTTFIVLLLQFGADAYTVASMIGKSDVSHLDTYVKLASIK